jgi:group I intron endonuclease
MCVNRCGVIYIVTNKQTGKSYIGQTIRSLKDRKAQHKRDYRKNAVKRIMFYAAINKYGWEEFEWSTLYSNIPEALLDIAEICAIYEYGTFGGGYNMTMGGDSGMRGRNHSDDTRDKIGKSTKSFWDGNDVMKKRYSNMFSGNPICGRRGDKHNMFGKHHSDETKSKISNTNSGHYGWTLSWKVITPNGTIVLVDNLKEYCRNNNLSPSHMYSVAGGSRKQHKGYTCTCVDNNARKVLNEGKRTV